MTQSYIKLGDPTPHHGDRGDDRRVSRPFPRTLTIAVSRQAGARGGSIAKRVSRRLGWQIVDQEQMEFMAQQDGADDDLTAAALAWVDDRIHKLQDQRRLSNDPHVINMTRVALHLAAHGESVLLGRGAGHALPSASTLHVRVVAPRRDRIAYMTHLLRMTPQEAEKYVDALDRRRNQYLLDHFNVEASDPIHYDLVLNSSLLGEVLCGELIAQAARAKLLESDPELNDNPEAA